MTCTDCGKFLPIESEYTWVRAIDIHEPYGPHIIGDLQTRKLRHCIGCNPPVCCKCNERFTEAEFNNDGTFTCKDCYKKAGGVMHRCFTCGRRFGSECDYYHTDPDTGRMICHWHDFDEADSELVLHL